MNETLSKEQMENICRVGQGKETCAFLIMTPDGMSCAKGTDSEKILSFRRETGQMRAQGDNCSGPPEYKFNQPLRLVLN